MTDTDDKRRFWERLLRGAAWGGGVVLFLLPVAAELFWTEMDWGPEDFATWAVMLLLALAGFELGMRVSPNWAYRFATFIGVGAAFLLVWVNLAVGVIGSEDDPGNLLYGAVLAVGVLGAALSRLKAHGMAVTTAAMALGIVLTGVTALLARWGAGSEPNWFVAIAGSTLFWGTAWLVSAVLYRTAARQQAADAMDV